MKIKSFILAAAGACTIGALMPVSAAAVTVPSGEYEDRSNDLYTYRKYPDCIAITGCLSTEDDFIKIPESIEKLPVTHIWYKAFEDHTEIKDVLLPDSIVDIGVQSFKGCTSLESINIPMWTERICGGAFEGCTSLKYIDIPSYVEQVNDGAFRGCSSLADITVGSDNTEVGAQAFTATAWFDAQPDGVVYLGTMAYAWKGEMERDAKVVFEDGTTKVGRYIFWKNENIAEVVMPESVTTIDRMAFSDCPRLKSLTFYNDRCHIYDFSKAVVDNMSISRRKSAMYSVVTSYFNGVIYGNEKSNAQQFAKQNKYSFLLIGEEKEAVAGDINGDGQMTVSDLLILYRQLLASPVQSYDMSYADLCADGVIDVFDLIEMRKALTAE